ncbi:MAG: M20/M25/M40 family metallo-hydrolase [Fidelibacterota bacterium]|nr:MAG: M20/M25/M40 family metallo-hydrolase [Candidatus Neomarinimicrobiota bacterium]
MFLAVLLILTGGCGGGGDAAAKRSITSGDLAADIAVLASDEFEGREPSTKGEELTLQFLKEEFEKLGLEPGNGDSYLQEVPLVEMTVGIGTGLLIWGDKTTTRLIYGEEYIARTKRMVKQISLDRSDMVFAGYGIVAPEYGWNDYEELDVEGKTVVLLVNDPGYATGDSTLFNGHAMTYYGRWPYKLEEAARQGAEGAFVIHETGPAGYPWEVIGRWNRHGFELVPEEGEVSHCAIEGWLNVEVVRELFQQAGEDFDALKELAATRDFRPVPVNLRISLTLDNTIRSSTSNNVLALLPGRNRPDEVVIYMAHWDHLGKDPSLRGDQIYNGAFDNATGVAGLLELAEAFSQLGRRPARSVLFLAVAAEEQGRLGSRYYATHPVFPLAKTVAAMNMDCLNVFGPMKDVTVIGYGNSELDNYVAAAAHKQRRKVRPDPELEKGYFYRSDHFSFVQEGVPALYLESGIDHVEHGEAWTREQIDRYTAERYHKVTDEFDPTWDLTGMVDDLRLLFSIGHRLSRERTFPNWQEDSEFRALRDSMMQGS